MKRTHHCNQLRISDIGQRVTLMGWVHSRRDHGGVVFIDLRDREGLTQIVFNPEHSATLAQEAQELRSEYVIALTGMVVKRLEGTANTKLATGEIEVAAEQLNIINTAETPPFQLDADYINEDLRLAYRYLDLRRPAMARNLRVRHEAVTAVREFLNKQNFLDIETPMLFKSTPEGAREFLVPSRLHPGKFYALPQSPQQFKQLLMVGGIERYYQIARCFRDEDLRADRQLEFTQIDIEMSFIQREDIYELVEGMLKTIWKRVLDRDIPTPFPQLTFKEALDTYGIDKPDRRFDFKLVDLTDDFRKSEFKVFRNVVTEGGVIKAINAKGFACVTSGQIETLSHVAKSLGAKGLAWIKVEKGAWDSPIVKFFSEAEKQALTQKLQIEEGDLILFAADQWLPACEVLGQIRLRVAEYLEKLGKLERPQDVFDFFWVVDFPLLTFDKDQQRHLSTHHPFTAPVPEDVALLESEPHRVRGQHYDVVLNGWELGGGSIRIHKPDVQQKLFTEILKIAPEIAESRFGYMIRAFRYGVPPHGGIALGLDRLVAILAGCASIRDVMAFPKNNQGLDLMNHSPAEVEPRQLKDVHIRLASQEEPVKAKT